MEDWGRTEHLTQCQSLACWSISELWVNQLLSQKFEQRHRHSFQLVVGVGPNRPRAGGYVESNEKTTQTERKRDKKHRNRERRKTMELLRNGATLFLRVSQLHGPAVFLVPLSGWDHFPILIITHFGQLTPSLSKTEPETNQKNTTTGKCIFLVIQIFVSIIFKAPQ